ncbi:hypothetical protein GCM10010435_48150 [Winogradskya consettensis]|uniref:Uncharacterized protein n=1 Tax=Winogradskya consettensis TaxID=113560 RepID=A0A919SHT0_9ACTN|nr:hypothetical protein [Actinoplanes consettensis]GIM72990.1 hypothetical protein Aco04nite_33080 [Actinoplanes consettensis]
MTRGGSAFTTSKTKIDDAYALGAHDVVLSTDDAQPAERADTFDLLLDTVSAGYPKTPVMRTLAFDGALVSLGLPSGFDVSPMVLVAGRRWTGSGATT